MEEGKINDAEEQKGKPRPAEEKISDDVTESAESSILEEVAHEDPETLVSSEEESETSEPTYTEGPASTPVAVVNPESDPAEEAMIEEAENTVTEVLVSESDLSDDDLEQGDTTEEVQSDDDHEDDAEDIPHYDELNPEQLVVAAEGLLKSQPVQDIKHHIERIRNSLLKTLNEERDKKLQEFIADGGIEMDFEFIQPIREKFRKLYGEYRNKRQKFYRELEEQLNTNLRIKQELIEKLKELVNKEESIGDTFREFNQIQQDWRNTGPVPRNASGDLYRTYHFHVDNFYAYIKINKELRDLDFKRNKEHKDKLIAGAENLLGRDYSREVFKELQELHRKWKNVGPVEREYREPLWEKFSEATKKLHDKREQYFEQLREKAGEMIEKKREVIGELREVLNSKIDGHKAWQDAIKKVDEIATQFKKIGRASHPDNDKVWDEFRGILRDFNHSKNEFYKNLKNDQQQNLEKKRELLALAEKLKDSDNWRDTTNELKRIQAQWKTIGHVPRSESDKIWKQFRAACNHFFDRLSAQHKERDKSLLKNLETKKEILKALKEKSLEKGKQKEAVIELKEIINQWKTVGPVPRGENIDREFNQALDEKFQAIDLDRKESQKIRFENKMDSINEQGGIRELNRERDQVSRQIKDAEKELAQLETNLSFFSSSNPKNPFIKEAEANIQRQQEQIELHQQKLKMLNVKIRELQRSEEAAKNKEETTDSGATEA